MLIDLLIIDFVYSLMYADNLYIPRTISTIFQVSSQSNQGQVTPIGCLGLIILLILGNLSAQ